MDFFAWFTTHWFDLLQTTGIVGGLVFTGLTLHRDTRTQQATNVLKLTSEHRSLQMELITRPSLGRILREDADLKKEPVTYEEMKFVSLMIAHLYSTYQTAKLDVLKQPEGLTADIRGFFALPIPHKVWEEVAHLQDADFLRFIEAQR